MKFIKSYLWKLAGIIAVAGAVVYFAENYQKWEYFWEVLLDWVLIWAAVDFHGWCYKKSKPKELVV